MSPLRNKNALRLAIENSNSIKEVLRYLGLSTSGSAYQQVRKWAEYHSLDLPQHTRPASKNPVSKPRTLQEKLQKGTLIQSSKLLVNLVAAGLKQNHCEECGQGPIWNGKPLTLHLDHIDGDHENNLLENLRILCPHCHQQTPTFGAKNIKSKPQRKNFCACGVEISKNATNCRRCMTMPKSQPKILWPSIEEILELLEIYSFVEVGQRLGVTDNAVRKYIKRNGYIVPKRYKTKTPNV